MLCGTLMALRPRLPSFSAGRTLGALLVAAGLVGAGAAKGAPAPGATPPARVQVRYDGAIAYEGHFNRPHEIRTFHSRTVYSADGRGRVRVDWTTWAEDDSATATPETFLVAGDSVFHRDAPGQKWSLFSGDRRRLGWIQAAAGIPSELGRIVREQTDKNRGEFMFDGSSFLYTEKHSHPRLGDVVDSVGYIYAADPNTPTEILISLHERDAQWRLTQRVVGSPSSAAPDSLFEAPRAFETQADIDSLVDEPKIVPVAPGLWAAEMDDIDSRSMFVEFANYLAVIEMAVGSANGERLVDAARRKWPSKPIRYAFFSHHHPHYLGGLRAMIAEGATVVTTPGNEAYVREIATYPFTMAPDRLARAPKPVKIKTFKDRFELADSTNQLVAINYGERSSHTDEFVVFWFPRAKLLFEAEQGWLTIDGVLRGTRRAAPLLAWLTDQKLDVEQFVQSWPMRDTERQVSRAKLEELAHPVKH